MRRYLLAVTAAAVGVATATPHQHKHQHLHQRWLTTTTQIVATATIFEVNGTPISKEDACHGVEDGEYTWKNPVDGNGVCTTSPSAAPTSAPASSTWAASPSEGGAGFYQASSSSSAPGSASSTWTGWNGGGQGVDSDFPDGTLDCSTFPSQYGAVALDYLGMAGWAGLQSVTWGGGAISNIVTGVAGNTCTEGMMCSYACPPGYQKSQWPSTQGALGQSVGGIQCSGGKLKLTNAGLSTKLCIPGQGGVQATNNAGGIVSICRTDYPGTEGETIPVALQPGETQPLANPDAATYYNWQSKSTSAQYYLNPIGYGPEQACKWGDASQPLGNFAPINFGVGYSGGKTWLSIFQNQPTTYAQYQGKVELQGDISDKCYYQNGQYCGATGCNSNGCTVAVNSGTATFVISQ